MLVLPRSMSRYGVKGTLRGKAWQDAKYCEFDRFPHVKKKRIMWQHYKEQNDEKNEDDYKLQQTQSQQ